MFVMCCKCFCILSCCVSSQACRAVFWRWRRRRSYKNQAEPVDPWSHDDAVPLSRPFPHVAVCQEAPGNPPEIRYIYVLGFYVDLTSKVRPKICQLPFLFFCSAIAQFAGCHSWPSYVFFSKVDPGVYMSFFCF